ASSRETTERVFRAQQVQDDLARLLARMQDVESGSRSFAVTGEPAFLAPFEASLKPAVEHVRKLQQMNLPSDQSEALGALEPLITQRIATATRLVELRKKVGFEAARTEVLSGSGQAAMDEIRSLIARMDAAEQAQQDHWAAESRRDAGIATALSTGSTGLGVALILGMFFLTVRENRLREQMAAAVAHANQRLQGVLAAATELAIISTNEDGVIQVFNTGAERMLGYRAEEIVGKVTPQIFHLGDEVRQRGEELARQSGHPVEAFNVFVHEARQGRHDTREWTYVRKDGTHLTVRLVVTPVRDGSGSISGFLGVAQDVTGLKQAEAQRDRFFDLSLDMLCIAGTDGYFKRVNPAFNYLGYSTEELLARPFLDFVHPDDREATVAEVEKLRGGLPTVDFENRYRCQDGSWRWLSWRTQPVVEENLLYATARDITERKVAEQSLREANAFLDSVIENIPNMVFIKDATDLRFVRFNRAGEMLLGRGREQLVGRNDYDFFPKEEADFFTAKDREVLAGGQLVDIPQERIDVEGGMTRILHTKKLPVLDETGRPKYLLGISEDITERTQAEAAIRDLNRELRLHALQLAEANKELESFSYSVSHDLRAPLRHIQGYVEMLQRATDGQLSEKAQRYLRTILDAGTEMGQLIDDLLAFSRMGRTALAESCVDLGKLVDDTLRGLDMSRKDRTIVWEVSTLPQVVGDASMLKLVLVNLISNAVKYTRPRAQAHIAIGCAGEEDDQLIFYVRDNGAGFDMQYVDKLFGVFQRLHRADEFEGTGIGLATVRRIVTRHGGRVWAEGAVNQGATFYFTLKRSPEEACDEHST
ncbi:MAG TPA: PAS domain S-box protein, partial [Rhodothermales bacterium]|nr:PAS domain S-box protein [Rhodothermales bacterium]